MDYQKKIYIDFSKVFAPATEEQLRKRNGGMGNSFRVKFVERIRGYVAQLKWSKWIVSEAHHTKGGELSILAEKWNRDKLFVDTNDKKLMAVQMSILQLTAVLTTNDMRLPDEAPPGLITHIEEEIPYVNPRV